VAEVIDSRAFSDFCGVDSSNQVPDGDTLGRFRNLLIRKWDTRKAVCPGDQASTGARTAAKKGNHRRFHTDLRPVKHQKCGKAT